MHITRRRLATLLGASLLAQADLSAPAWAQGPDKKLRVVVGYTPGGAIDTVARAVADGMRGSGYSVIVENKPGAAGRLATEAVATGGADGTTLLMAPLGNLTIQPHTFDMRVEPLKDLTGVGLATGMSFAIAVGANSPARTLQEWLALARKDPAQGSYGTPGAGTAMHFLGTMLSRDAKVPLTHVPYKGGSAALTDAIGGNLPAIITTLPNLLPMHRAGKLRILAISEAQHNAALPDVPTLKSIGYPDLVVEENFGFFARAGTPGPVIDQLNQAINAAVKSPKVTRALQKLEFTPRTIAPQALNAQVRAEHAEWGRVIKATGYQSGQ